MSPLKLRMAVPLQEGSFHGPSDVRLFSISIRLWPARAAAGTLWAHNCLIRFQLDGWMHDTQGQQGRYMP